MAGARSPTQSEEKDSSDPESRVGPGRYAGSSRMTSSSTSVPRAVAYPRSALRRRSRSALARVASQYCLAPHVHGAGGLAAGLGTAREPWSRSPGPIPAAKPVAHFPPALLVVGEDMARHRVVHEHGLYADRVVAEDLLPMAHERFSVRRILRWECRHPVCFEILLMVEELCDIVIDDVSKPDLRLANRLAHVRSMP